MYKNMSYIYIYIYIKEKGVEDTPPGYMYEKGKKMTKIDGTYDAVGTLFLFFHPSTLPPEF